MHRVASVLAALLGAGAVAHCDRSGPSPYRGQSGSEVVDNGEGEPPPGGDTVPCPCGAPGWLGNGPGAFLRATVLAREAGAFSSPEFPWCGDSDDDVGGGTTPRCGRLTLRVEEQISGDVALAAGDEIEVATDGLLPCFRGNESVAVGALAFASVSWPLPELPECAARQPCLDACAREYGEQQRACELAAGDAGVARGECSGDGDDECRGSCDGVATDECPPRPPPSAEVLRSAGSARLAPWGDTIVFAATAEAELRVPVGDLDELSGDFQHAALVTATGRACPAPSPAAWRLEELRRPWRLARVRRRGCPRTRA